MTDSTFCRFFLAAACLLVGTGTEGLSAPLSGGDPQTASCPRVIVLRGGQVFQGQITRSGDFYHVKLPIGEIRVRAAKVAFDCETLEQAYREQRAAFRFDSADEHIELARWCQRNGLLTQAASELAEAMADEPNSPRVAHFERQLKLAMQPKQQKPRPTVRQPDGPTLEQLDEMMRQMPSGSVEMFTNSIQPLLVNSCTTSGCHSPQKNEGLRLIRTSPGRPPNRRVTQRNLHAVLEWIDRRRPENSRLLTEAIRAHGNVEKPIFTNKDVLKYRQMVQWVHYVATADRQKNSAPKTLDPHGILEAASPIFAAQKWGSAPEGLAKPLPAEKAHPAAEVASPWELPFNVSTPSATTGRSPAKRGTPLKRFVPADPFDPEIFNRRYHPKN